MNGHSSSVVDYKKQKFMLSLNVSIDRDLEEHLKKMSAQSGRSVSSIVRRTLYKLFLNKVVE